MSWVIDNPSRFLSERESIEKLGQEGWLTGVRWRIGTPFRVEVDFTLVIGEKLYDLQLTYPNLFPDTPAFIHPRNASHRLSGHQYGESGSLCLEYRPDNWDASITGAELIRSAHRLLTSEGNGGPPVPFAHHLTLGQNFAGQPYRFLVTPELLQELKAAPESRRFAAQSRTIFHGSEQVTFVSHIQESDGTLQPFSGLPNDKDAYEPMFTVSGEVRIFHVPETERTTVIGSLEKLAEVVRMPPSLREIFQGSDHEARKNETRFVLLHFEGANVIRAFAIRDRQPPILFEYTVMMPEKTSERLPTEHKQLEKYSVAIIGLGSIGSKVAVSLARSGLRQFLLVDDDLFLTGNLRRNELSWMSIGIHKNKGVRELMNLVAPGCQIEDVTHRITGQESSKTASAVLDAIGKCDLLIDATADPSVFVLLAALARRNKKPICWAELFAGGVGGMIARARPNFDPNPLAVRNAITAHLNTQQPAPYQNAVSYDADDIRPLIAYDSDVGQIASSLTRFAIDTLLRKADTYFPYQAYLIGLRKEWIFLQPFDVHPIETFGEGWQPRTNDTDESLNAAVAILADLAAKSSKC
jgi:molybdopterin/thiamine biosynthesis adenylyltransferase